MLVKHRPMWDGSLGKINMMKHRIEPNEDANLHSCPPYQAMSNKVKLTQTETSLYLSADIIKPDSIPWGAPVVFAPKNTKPYDSAWTITASTHVPSGKHTLSPDWTSVSIQSEVRECSLPSTTTRDTVEFMLKSPGQTEDIVHVALQDL